MGIINWLKRALKPSPEEVEAPSLVRCPKCGEVLSRKEYYSHYDRLHRPSLPEAYREVRQRVYKAIPTQAPPIVRETAVKTVETAEEAAKKAPGVLQRLGLGKAAGAMSPYTCRSCGAPLHKTITGKYICSNPNCPYSGIERKAEHIEKIHSSKILRSAIFMALGAIPLIFPGGPAGLAFMFGIWAMVLDLYFPHKPRGNPAAMFLKGFGKTISYLLFAFGFFLLNLIFPSLIILFLGYYSFPSGIADMDKYNIVQGIFKSFMAIVMTIFTFMFLGGPVQFKLVLSALIIAFFFTIPSAYGEMATLIIFVFASIIALFLGATSLGAPPQSIIGLALILVSLLFYMVSKLGEKEKQQEEEREEKEKKKKLELEEKELEAKEEKVEKEEKGYVESKGQIYSKGGGKWSTCPKCNTQVNIEHYTKCPTCGYDMSKLPKKEEK